VRQEAERIVRVLVAQVESLSEEELTEANRYDWQEGESLWEETPGNGLPEALRLRPTLIEWSKHDSIGMEGSRSAGGRTIAGVRVKSYSNAITESLGRVMLSAAKHLWQGATRSGSA